MKKLLDVWIGEADTVYRDVPYSVVADWLQQGRLLADDRIRPAGGKNWSTIAKVPAFAAYLPRAEPHASDDEAEALEPVDLGLHWKGPAESEDEDVDMIPLIDISLVLLIFFMMTATVSTGALDAIALPQASHQLADVSQDSFWIGIDARGDKKSPYYSLGINNTEISSAQPELDLAIAGLASALGKGTGDAKVRLRAHQDLPIEVIKGTTLKIQELAERINQGRDRSQRLTISILGEVNEVQGK